ncbi:TetR/AcrR family transcriptional regulator [Ilumatobacter nonamiensis]|uniref:TetR/AcrR family transcriptional regulator n=1 Tax=Ilumatobacter nonamiensis TaxID=467093 RepID=UPI00130E2184|nr:TetR/AcrR family transcriptional regulator [Ilumatobacter nonamiensis]
MATRSSTPTDATRRRNARGEGDRLRVDLLDAAAELMAEHGTIEGISLRAVARQAGVSPTAVYRHFDDHLDLLRESVARCWRNFYDVMVEARDSTDDPYDAFRAAGDAYVRFAMEKQGQYRVLFSNRIHLDVSDVDFPASMESPDDSLDAGFSAFQVLVDLVTAILERNGDDRDADFVAFQVHAWIHGIVDLVGCHPNVPWPSTDTMLDGLATALRLDRP